ncbi:MAG: hypothetical protein N2C14_23715, partial [Planctomycetales bacterium]
DPAKVADFLQQKSAIREIDARKSEFNEDIRERASQAYDKRVLAGAPRDFISFDEDWAAVKSLVDSLNIPE